MAARDSFRDAKPAKKKLKKPALGVLGTETRNLPESAKQKLRHSNYARNSDSQEPTDGAAATETPENAVGAMGKTNEFSIRFKPKQFTLAELTAPAKLPTAHVAFRADPAELGGAARGRNREISGAAEPEAEVKAETETETEADVADSVNSATNEPSTTNTTQLTFYALDDHPLNRKGFKYLPARPNPFLPSLKYTPVELPPFGPRLDYQDKSHLLYTDLPEARCATTEKGFRSARANIGIREGQYYFEVKILRGNDEAMRAALLAREREKLRKRTSRASGQYASAQVLAHLEKQTREKEAQLRGLDAAHVRVGLTRREASTETPVGYDAYGYGLRDKSGDFVHVSRRRKFMEPFGTGDVLGFWVKLPSLQEHAVCVAQFVAGKDKSKKRPEKRAEVNPEVSPEVSRKMPSLSDIIKPDCGANPPPGVRRFAYDVVRDRIPIRYKGQTYFEQFEYQPAKAMEELFNPVKWSATASNNLALTVSASERVEVAQQKPKAGKAGKAGKSGKAGKRKTQKAGKNSESEAEAETEFTEPPRLPGSFVRVFKNGRYIGTMEEGLYAFLPPFSKPLSSATGVTEFGTFRDYRGVFPEVYKQLNPHLCEEFVCGAAEFSVGNSAHKLSRGNGNGKRQSKEKQLKIGGDDGSLGYYPTVSCFRGGVAQTNLGPAFECWPSFKDPIGTVMEVPIEGSGVGGAAGLRKEKRRTKLVNSGKLDFEFRDGDDDMSQLIEKGIVKPLSDRYIESIADEIVWDCVDEIEAEMMDLQEGDFSVFRMAEDSEDPNWAEFFQEDAEERPESGASSATGAGSTPVPQKIKKKSSTKKSNMSVSFSVN